MRRVESDGVSVSDSLEAGAMGDCSLGSVAVGAGPAMARRSKRTLTPGLTSRVTILPSRAVIRPSNPDVVVISSPTPSEDCSLCDSFVRRRWVKNSHPINSTGNAKISRLDPLLEEVAATNEDMSQSFVEVVAGAPGHVDRTGKSSGASRSVPISLGERARRTNAAVAGGLKCDLAGIGVSLRSARRRRQMAGAGPAGLVLRVAAESAPDESRPEALPPVPEGCES